MRHFIAYHNTEKMGRPLHDGELAQEFHRVPSAGVSKGRLDLRGGAGRRANRLPQESTRALLRRSAELVGFARRTGNQQFVKQHSCRR